MGRVTEVDYSHLRCFISLYLHTITKRLGHKELFFRGIHMPICGKLYTADVLRIIAKTTGTVN